MKIIRPMDITDVAPAALTASNMTSPETGTTDWDSGTAYALDDEVTFDTGGATVTISYASPAVVTFGASHELVSGDKISFTTTGALPSNISTSTLYYVNNVLTDTTFTISSTNGGKSINTVSLAGNIQSGTHSIVIYIHAVFRSLQGGNTGNSPRLLSKAAWWQRIGTSNKYKMFDGAISLQAIGAGSITGTVTVSKAVDTIVFFNLSAYSVQITCTDDTLGSVYSETHIVSEEINGTFEDIPDLVITNIPDLSSGTIAYTILKSALYPVTASACGEMLIGYAVDAGGTEYGASVGVQDFSVIEQNDFGDYDIVPRTNRKLGSFQIMVPNASRSRVYRILSQQKTKKTLYIGSDGISETAIYGFPGEWQMIIQYPEYSIVNIDVLGLT